MKEKKAQLTVKQAYKTLGVTALAGVGAVVMPMVAALAVGYLAMDAYVRGKDSFPSRAWKRLKDSAGVVKEDILDRVEQFYVQRGIDAVKAAVAEQDAPQSKFSMKALSEKFHAAFKTDTRPAVRENIRIEKTNHKKLGG